ncbi:hypothetical protein G9A89_005980 [Geosiphon pyriformis]|nr:hypothetical protein G9A89_005980 [Geosiphon pyriformis]
MKATANSTALKKKAPKGAFQDSAGGFFSQKKKIVLGNMKHSGDEKNISLNKAGSSGSMYFNVESLSGENEDISMSGTDEKKWIDPKIIKTPVEVSVKKLFALDINFSAVEDKSTMAKTQLIRKIFSTVNGFERATISSKFERIIRSTFISKKSIEMIASLVRENKIVINTNLKKQGMHSNWAVVIKEIPMDMPKDMIITTITKFSEIKSIRIQLIGMWQKAVVEFVKSSQANLLASKWSFLIGKDSIRVAKAVEDCNVWTSRDWFRTLLFTLLMETTAHNLGTLLEKTGEKTCIINCSLETGNRFHCAVVGFESNEELESAFLTVPIFSSVRFSWARLDLVWYEKCEHFGHSVLECNASNVLSFISSELLTKSSLGCWSKGILSDQVSVILKKLSFIELVSLVAPSCALSLAVSVPSASVVDSDMTLDNVLALADSLFFGSSESATVLSSSDSKVLTSKVSGLEFKMSVLEASFSSILSFLGTGVAIIMANFLACHVTKIEEVSGCVVVVRLLFKDKFLVSVVGLYAGASSGTCFGQASKVNSVIAKAVNFSCFVILGGNFNENRSGRNSLASAVTGHRVGSVSDFFDTDHCAVSVSVGMGGLLDSRLSSLCKQANKNHWKFLIKTANETKWSWFRDCTSAKLLAVSGEFLETLAHADVNGMWVHLEKVLVDSADEIFSRHWFIAKVVKELELGNLRKVNQLINVWAKLDGSKAAVIANMIQVGGKFLDVLKQLLLFQKEYRKSKMYKSKLAEEASVWKAIECRIEKFCSDKGAMIRNVLDWSFYKVVFNHLVVNDELVLEPGMVKLGVNEIIEGWIKKKTVPSVVSDVWVCQYALLDYVRDDAFSSVICSIDMSELLLVVNKLPNGKTAGLSVSVGFAEFMFDCRGCTCFVEKSLAKKILSKILSDHISLACSKFVLKGTSTQSLVFAVGSVIKDALEKNREVWLVLQDMCKAYNLVGWHHLRASLWHIKICKRFVLFFGSIHENRVNRVMTDFGLSNSYVVYNGLDQGEVFLPLLWRIFYDPLLCKVKRHEQFFRYRIDFRFVSRSGCIESGSGFSSYFVAGVFFDDTIWIGNCQTATQNILDIASGFFVLNDISINNEKTVAILINQDIRVASLCISGLPISIAKKEEAYCYLGIFLSTDGLSKPSLAKAHSDVRFFTNVVFRKTITNKQFSYLVLAVLQPIVSYRTQFSFVLLSVYYKWDVMLRKSLKSKAGLLCDFSTEALCYPSLYGLKSFEQVQSERKLAALISISNSFGVLGHLFNYRFLDLQVLGWSPLNSLQFPVKLCVSPVNNFLAGVVKIFLYNKLSLANNLPNVFRSPGYFSVSSILGGSLFFDSVHLLKQFGVAFGDRLFNKKDCVMSWETFQYWKRLDSRGPASHWFKVVSEFLCDRSAFMAVSVESACSFSLSMLDTKEFSVVQNGLHEIWSGSFEVFMGGFVRNYGHADVASGAAAYFPTIDLSVGIKILGLLFSTMAELQAIALALECIPFSCSVVLHFDSQMAINACISEMSLSVPDFHSSCWLERCQIFNLVCDKNLSVHWVKVKGHFGVYGNIRVDAAAGDAAFSQFSLPVGVSEHFLVAENILVFGNTCYFVQDLFRSICCAQWEMGPGQDVILTIRRSSYLRTYLMKAVHHQMSVVVRKWLYDKCYPGVLCLLYYEVELLDHVFTLSFAGFCSLLSSAVLRSLDWCFLDVDLYFVLCKEFVLRDWCVEAMEVLDSKKETISIVVGFVGYFVKLHCSKAWLVKSPYRVKIEAAGLVGDNTLISGLFHCINSLLSSKVVRILGVINFFAISFGRHRSCLFFSGLDGSLCVLLGI